MKEINIGHLASFHGNVGDQLNHLSFRPWMQTQIRSSLKWTEFEIRDCYRKKKTFNPDFFNFAISKDLVVIGGGNFFELWPENSINGTSIDLSFQEIQDIGKPVFFNSLGVDAGQGMSKRAEVNFKTFFESIANDPLCFVSVRNDGSLEQLKALNIDTDHVTVLPDAAFFYNNYTVGSQASINIGLNIAEDMKTLRYEDGDGETFLRSLARTIEDLSEWNDQIKFVFFPHIYSDIAFISRLLNLLTDQIVRNKVTVEKYSTISDDAMRLPIAYGKCDLVVATRFHANVLPLGMGVPTIGLNTYPQIYKLYDEIGLQEQCISPDGIDFESKLQELIHDALLRNSHWVSKQALMKNKIVNDRKKVGIQLSSWLKRNIGE
jgi:polysaccharide pyruvyl transferase WcaK-like protein